MRTAGSFTHNHIHFRQRRLGTRSRRLNPRIGGLRLESDVNIIINRTLRQCLANHMNELASCPNSAEALQSKVCTVLHFLSRDLLSISKVRIEILLRPLCHKHLIAKVVIGLIRRVLLVYSNHNIRGKPGVHV